MITRRTPIKRCSIGRSRKAARERASGIAVQKYACGREVCLRSTAGVIEYARRLVTMEIRQHFLCAICHRPFGTQLPACFGHERSRGGGKRDDRVLHDDGRWRNAALCHECNGKQGSKWYEWRDGLFVPVVL